MKLGFFSTEYIRKRPGMAESDRELCHELARRGTEVQALVEDRGVPPGDVIVDQDGPVRLWRYQGPRFRPLSLRAYADKGLKAISGSPRLASLLALYRRFLAAHGDLDLLQVEAPFPEGTLVALAARRAGTPFIVSARGWERVEFPRLRERAIRWTLRRAAGVRPNAPNMARILVERFGADPGRVRTIRTNLSREAYLPPGTDLGAFRAAGRPRVRARYGLRHESLLAAAARFVPSKGLEHLLEAVRLLRDREAPVGLILCGDGSLRALLEQQAGALGIRENVAFAGAVPHAEMRDVFAGVDLLVVPALLDWTPRAAVEAAVVGTPAVVTSGVGCAPWMAEAGAGLVVPPGDAEALARAIRGWLDGTAEREEAGRRAVAWAGTFAVERVAEEMEQFHRAVLAAGRRAP